MGGRLGGGGWVGVVVICTFVKYQFQNYTSKMDWLVVHSLIHPL